jgi:uncharacterized protein
MAALPDACMAPRPIALPEADRARRTTRADPRAAPVDAGVLMDRSITASPRLPSARQPHLAAALGIIALYFFLQLIVSGAAGLLLGFIAGLFSSHGGHAPSPRTLGVQVRQLLAQPDANALIVICTLVITATTILLLVRRRWPALWSQSQPPGLGFTRPPQPAFYVMAVLCGLALPVIGSWLTQWLAHGHEVTQDIKQLGSATAPGLRIPLVLVVVSVGPLVEELLFRGVLLSALLRHMRVGWAVGISSLLFAFVHLPDLGYLWYAVPNLALLAAVLAWLRLRSGSLWPAVLAHGVNNVLAVVAWFVVVNPPT